MKLEDLPTVTAPNGMVFYYDPIGGIIFDEDGNGIHTVVGLGFLQEHEIHSVVTNMILFGVTMFDWGERRGIAGVHHQLSRLMGRV